MNAKPDFKNYSCTYIYVYILEINICIVHTCTYIFKINTFYYSLPHGDGQFLDDTQPGGDGRVLAHLAHELRVKDQLRKNIWIARGKRQMTGGRSTRGCGLLGFASVKDDWHNISWNFEVSHVYKL